MRSNLFWFADDSRAAAEDAKYLRLVREFDAFTDGESNLFFDDESELIESVNATKFFWSRRLKNFRKRMNEIPQGKIRECYEGLRDCLLVLNERSAALRNAQRYVDSWQTELDGRPVATSPDSYLLLADGLIRKLEIEIICEKKSSAQTIERITQLLKSIQLEEDDELLRMHSRIQFELNSMSQSQTN